MHSVSTGISPFKFSCIKFLYNTIIIRKWCRIIINYFTNFPVYGGWNQPIVNTRFFTPKLPWLFSCSWNPWVTLLVGLNIWSDDEVIFDQYVYHSSNLIWWVSTSRFTDILWYYSSVNNLNAESDNVCEQLRPHANWTWVLSYWNDFRWRLIHLSIAISHLHCESVCSCYILRYWANNVCEGRNV